MPKGKRLSPEEWKVQQQAKTAEIMEKLEKGVTDTFNSEEYQKYLKTMSKFHKYSVSNSMLIHLQNPDATYVAGYEKWKEFDRQVNKGEKGIKIIAPIKRNYDMEVEKTNPETGEITTETEKNPLIFFKMISVFDISQTSGQPLPEFKIQELEGNPEAFDKVMAGITDAASLIGYTVRLEDIEGSAKGYCQFTDREIVIKEGMSNAQTMKTGIHELAHAKMHSVDALINDGRNTVEVQAESVAFVVSSHFGLDTSDYSFPYITTWSKGKEPTELKNSLKQIRDASNEIIDLIETHNIFQSKQNDIDSEKRRENEMKIELNGDALTLLEDFVKYSNLDPENIADAMYYDVNGFKQRLSLLEKAMNEGNELNKEPDQEVADKIDEKDSDKPREILENLYTKLWEDRSSIDQELRNLNPGEDRHTVLTTRLNEIKDTHLEKANGLLDSFNIHDSKNYYKPFQEKYWEDRSSVDEELRNLSPYEDRHDELMWQLKEINDNSTETGRAFFESLETLDEQYFTDLELMVEKMGGVETSSQDFLSSLNEINENFDRGVDELYNSLGVKAVNQIKDGDTIDHAANNSSPAHDNPLDLDINNLLPESVVDEMSANIEGQQLEQEVTASEQVGRS